LYDEMNSTLDALVAAPHPLPDAAATLEEQLNALGQVGMEAQFELEARGQQTSQEPGGLLPRTLDRHRLPGRPRRQGQLGGLDPLERIQYSANDLRGRRSG
jgi:hypothetical protein